MKKPKRKKQKKSKSSKKKQGQNKNLKKLFEQTTDKDIPKISFPRSDEYYWNRIFESDEEYLIFHPTIEIHFRNKIEKLCKKPLSTRSVELLERLYQRAEDVMSRSLLAKKILSLQRDYLQSFKWHSDRALIMLAERENLFDKWEGIFILGCFAGKNAIVYLQDLCRKANNELIIQTTERAIQKIELNVKKKIRERGF
ncbi:MAG: hypothetical protein ACE5HX_06755 [bacterium]